MTEHTLDPAHWSEFREEAHQALDTMLDYLRDVRERPVWQPVPDDVAARLTTPVPEDPEGLGAVLDEFRQQVLPYPSGNLHPRFWSWVSGNGSPTGMIADMLISGLNPLGLGFDDSAPSRVEMQVVEWFKSIFGFPTDASGLLVSGGSMANLVGIAVGRTAKSRYDVRLQGARADGHKPLAVYCSTETHSSVQKAVEVLGMGADCIRFIPVNDAFEIDLAALGDAIRADLTGPWRPAILVANAGTVNTGAIDDMGELRRIARQYDLWLHVDGAFGAIAALLPEPPRNLAGMEEADSLAFDLHKWLHQPYNIGCVLVRHAREHVATFNATAAYLEPPSGGVAAGPVNFSALGVQLSRSGAALRPWLSFKVHGLRAFRELTHQNVEQARYLEGLVEATPDLELLAPTSLNIVNYRFNPGGLPDTELNPLNERLLVTLQEQGIAAPSSTMVGRAGKRSIRVCITNHRSRREDFDALVDATIAIGRELLGSSALTPP